MAKLSRFVRNKAWNRYQKIIEDFIDLDAGRQIMIWRRARKTPLNWGEDDDTGNYDNIELEVLCNYNAFRTWPVNVPTVSGEKDIMNLAVLITAKQLGEKKLLNSSGYWIINGILDEFIINGKLYKAKGDTQVAQAKDVPISFQLILQRQEIENETILELSGEFDSSFNGDFTI